MTTFAYDLAVSAVASDAGLVAELITEIAPRLRTMARWSRGEATSADGVATLGAEHSRLVLVVHQLLWRDDQPTNAEGALLRDRLRERPGSVCVLTFDDAPVPGWLARAPRYDVMKHGRSGAVDFVANRVAAAGGTVKPRQRADNEDSPRMRWPEPPAPFLAQPRAHSALRHQLDGIIADLEREIVQCRSARPDQTFELHALPHRVIARFDDVAISFSWVTGRLSTIADGRLLVIAWRDVAPGSRGAAALTAAAPLHERTYLADGKAPEDWRWRSDDRASQPYASPQLVADWIARAGIARAG
jgi:hypothetical protein